MSQMKFLSGILLLALGGLAHAATFEMSVSPSRIVTTGKPGARVGQSISINNIGNDAGEVAIRTLDWSFSDAGTVTYHDELLPGSCRPWVTLERRFIKVAPRGRVQFRFQVEVPADAKRGECRFMIAIQGAEPAYRAQIQGSTAALNLPVSGRIAIAVYVAVDGAAPKLEVKELGVAEVNKVRVPVITVANTGDAHGRLDGALDAVDAANVKFELVADGSPILPGQTRTLPLQPRAEAAPNAKPAYPLRAEGQLDWELGSFKIKSELK